VLTYILRRLLLMVPTIAGILIINFVVLRLQGDSFDSVMKSQAEGGAGNQTARRVSEAAAQQALIELAPTGNLLPAVLNLRGFASREDILAGLAAAEAVEGRPLAETDRAAKALWCGGWLYVEPLLAILVDESLARWHAPASRALTLCAYAPLYEALRRDLGDAAFDRLRDRNRALDGLAIRFTNRPGEGYRTDAALDPEAARKRATLLAFGATWGEDFRRTPGRVAASILGETGFMHFLGRLCTGSLYSTKRQAYVFSLIAERWQVTAVLSLLSIVLAWGIAIPLGIRSARRAGSLEDRVVGTGLFAAWSLPQFFVGTLLLSLLCTDSASGRAPFPGSGLSSRPEETLWLSGSERVLDWAWHGILPLVVLTYASFTVLSRYMRSGLLDQLDQDYVRAARARGCDMDRAVWRHAVPNSLISMITLAGGLLAALLGGSVFVERIFSIDGLGLLLYEAAIARDVQLVMGATLISVVLLLVGILLADLAYAWADPRIRSRYAGG
jgi:peptide/nickel transport system permease protein